MSQATRPHSRCSSSDNRPRPAGTSGVAPLWAGLFALINESFAPSKAGAPHAKLYANAAAFRDIVKGTNGAYKAGPGWDACTGLGSPNGTAINALY